MPLYAIEQRAHRRPWSEKVFMASVGTGYRWRQLTLHQQAVGFTVCQQVVDELTLHNIAVAPDYQGRGFGRLLLNDVLDHAARHGLIVFLEVRVSNHAAIHLYTQSGFETVGRRPNYYANNDGREDGLVMRWQANRNLT
ncbi:ribosomal protein S18-alanine N-acetyltransferase [Idiomarina aquatica]|uniref:ribosomal protein S18-alanine N-acetyltransferase n=1 Tax=Idiomarina aquatica TaxID=1327752 RepID=UPI0023AA4412|nr:ribosomal protein S18-alanine N-acetyltransferase [Idiomarina aquatica]